MMWRIVAPIAVWLICILLLFISYGTIKEPYKEPKYCYYTNGLVREYYPRTGRWGKFHSLKTSWKNTIEIASSEKGMSVEEYIEECKRRWSSEEPMDWCYQ